MDTVGEQVLLFVLYFVWEIIPTAFVLVLFWQPKAHATTSLSVVARKYGTIEAASDVPIIASLNVRQVHSFWFFVL